MSDNCSSRQALPCAEERTPVWLVNALEAAGAIQQRMPAGASPRRVRSNFPGTNASSRNAEAVSAADITFMETAYAWVTLIPERDRVRRVLVQRRSLRIAGSGKYLWPWRRLGADMNCSHEAARKWHGEGIMMILQALSASGGTDAKKDAPRDYSVDKIRLRRVGNSYDVESQQPQVSPAAFLFGLIPGNRKHERL